MKPENLKMITEKTGSDERGNLYFKNSDDEWESFADIQLKSEKSTDSYVRSLFTDSLVNENDAIQIRVLNGRLRWIRSDKADESWNELTPNLAKQIEAGLYVAGDDATPSPEVIAIQEPEAYEIGWYQDIKGDLYQFDGKTWVGKAPSKKEIEALEYLG